MENHGDHRRPGQRFDQNNEQMKSDDKKEMTDQMNYGRLRTMVYKMKLLDKQREILQRSIDIVRVEQRILQENIDIATYLESNITEFVANGLSAFLKRLVTNTAILAALGLEKENLEIKCLDYKTEIENLDFDLMRVEVTAYSTN